jgi:hypothetical protein
MFILIIKLLFYFQYYNQINVRFLLNKIKNKNIYKKINILTAY